MPPRRRRRPALSLPPAGLSAAKAQRHGSGDIIAAAREHTLEAIDLLQAIMNDPETPVASRISAAALLLERGYGKSPQAVLIKEDAPVSGVHGMQLRDRIAALRESMSATAVTTDLEASAVTEVDAVELVPVVKIDASEVI